MLVGLGFGLGKVSFETFLINVPVESLKIPFFWGIPCLFAMKSGQVFMLREGCNEALI